MDGDTVAIDIVKASKYRYASRSRGKGSGDSRPSDYQLAGEFVAYSDEEIQETDLYGVVIPKDRKLNQFKVYAAAEGVRPVDGSIVMIELTHYPEKGYATSLEGIIKQVIGHKNDPGMDIPRLSWLTVFLQNFLMMCCLRQMKFQTDQRNGY